LEIGLSDDRKQYYIKHIGFFNTDYSRKRTLKREPEDASRPYDIDLDKLPQPKARI